VKRAVRKPQDEKKQGSLFKSYFASLAGDIATVARQAGVSRSRIYAALELQALGHENARKIASYVARRLDLSEREELELRADLLGTPENLVRAYLGSRMKTADLFSIDPENAGRILEPEGRIYYGAGLRAVESLEELGAPEYIISSVRERTLPPAGHRMGRGRFPEAEVRQARTGAMPQGARRAIPGAPGPRGPYREHIADRLTVRRKPARSKYPTTKTTKS
jgi:hypothetical protein